MIALKIHNGAGFRTITEQSSESLGILQRSGEYQYLPFIGFISLEASRKVNRYVKANIAGYCLDFTNRPEWFDCTLLLGTMMESGNKGVSNRAFIVLNKGVPMPVESQYYIRW